MGGATGVKIRLADRAAPRPRKVHVAQLARYNTCSIPRL